MLYLVMGWSLHSLLYCTHPGPSKTSLFSLVGSANDDVMEDVIVSFAAVKDRELDSKLFFAERFELIVDEVPVFRDFTCGIRIRT